MIKKIKNLKNKPINRLVVIFIFTLSLIIFALSIEFINNFFYFLRSYTHLPISDILSDSIYLLLCILFFLTYSRLKKTVMRRKKLENIIESIRSDVLLVTDSDDRILRANSALEQMFGYVMDEVVQQKVDILFDTTPQHSQDQDELANFVTQSGVDSYLAFGKRKDGVIFPVEIIKGNLQEKDEEGNVLVVRDISDRKKAEDVLLKYKNELEKRVKERTTKLKKVNVELKREVNARNRIENELRNFEEKLKIMFEYAPIAYYLNDTNGHIILANRVGKEILGVNGGRLSNKSLRDFTSMSKKETRKISEILTKNARGELSGPDEITFSKQDGQNVTAELWIYPVKINNQTMVLSIVSDINHQRCQGNQKKKL